MLTVKSLLYSKSIQNNQNEVFNTTAIHHQRNKTFMQTCMLIQIVFLFLLDVNAALSKFSSGSVSQPSLTRHLQQEMSSLIIERRMSRIPKGVKTRKEIWTPSLHISDLINVIPSRKTKKFNDFNLSINYTALRKTYRQEYGVHFDLCLRRCPHMFLIEGVLKTGDLRFENGLCVRDIYGGVDVQYALITNEVFPKDILRQLLKGEMLTGAPQKGDFAKELSWLEEFMLDTSTISEETVYSFNWMPVL